MYINGEKFNVKRYSSGELRLLRSELDKHIVDDKVEIIYSNELSIFELLLIIDYYKSNNILIDLILTYLPYQRMDHEGIDELNTVNNVANIFNNLNLHSLTICEPHCEINQFKNAKEVSYIKTLKEKVFKLANFDKLNDFVVFPDKGALRRYNGLAQNMTYFNKVRDKETGLIIKHEPAQEINKSCKVIIVDDIISTGDTLINIIDRLASVGIKDIYIFTGHVENNKYNNRIFKHPNIKKVFSTNSLRKKQNKKLKLFDIKEIFYEQENND